MGPNLENYRCPNTCDPKAYPECLQVFDHRLLHQARAVVSGTKQVVKMSVLSPG